MQITVVLTFFSTKPLVTRPFRHVTYIRSGGKSFSVVVRERDGCVLGSDPAIMHNWPF